jgi:C-terminal processing protease CtpA/Prc
MKNSLIIISAAFVSGVAIGLIIQNDPETTDLKVTSVTRGTAIEADDRNVAKNPDGGQVTLNLNKLNRLLQREIRARQALEQKFDSLSSQMANLDNNNESFKVIHGEQVESKDEFEISGADDKWFNEQALIDNGMVGSQANELKTYFEQLELERLYLRDRSIREGWDDERLGEAMQILADKEDDLKNRLSESDYDAYLYASGQTNRVTVTNVLASAEAGTAGIQSGDYIIRYDNQRIYSGFELQLATSSGSIGDTVSLEVDRDGETLQFYVPRGPLGIRMNSVSVAP